MDNNPEALLTQGQRDAIQHVSDAFPTGYYMMLCATKGRGKETGTHVLISRQNFSFLSCLAATLL